MRIGLFEMKWLDAAGEDHWFEAHQAESLAVAPLGWRREEGVTAGHLLLLRIAVVAMMTSKNRFLEGRPDFVHRPAAPLATLDFQNDFFVTFIPVCSLSVGVVAATAVAATVVAATVVAVNLCLSPPKLNHKAELLGTTQNPSPLAVKDGMNAKFRQKIPQTIPNLGNLSVLNNERAKQSRVDVWQLGNVLFLDPPTTFPHQPLW